MTKGLTRRQLVTSTAVTALARPAIAQPKLGGKLTYWGYDIHDLATNSTFEEVVYLLWHGRLPKPKELDELHEQLAEHRAVTPVPSVVTASDVNRPRTSNV